MRIKRRQLISLIRESFDKNSFPHAQNFMRRTKENDNIFHHIGIYSYEIDALKKFVSFNQSKNELKNNPTSLDAIFNSDFLSSKFLDESASLFLFLTVLH